MGTEMLRPRSLGVCRICVVLVAVRVGDSAGVTWRTGTCGQRARQPAPMRTTPTGCSFDRVARSSSAAANIRILDLDTGSFEPSPFLTIPGLDTTGEGGLLGMAFHPDYENNGKFYVNVTIDNGGLDFQGTRPFSTYIRQYTVSADPNVANTSPTPVLNFLQPQSNHDGGWIGFSPNDGYLYVATGDGGGATTMISTTAPSHTAGTGNAQDITDNLLGKMLRIDVDRRRLPRRRTATIGSSIPIRCGRPRSGYAGSDRGSGGRR